MHLLFDLYDHMSKENPEVEVQDRYRRQRTLEEKALYGLKIVE